MRRYFIYFSYDGTRYCGWQIQPNGLSVQEVLTKAMSTILREKIELVAAGRTDAGVHAQCMVAHFDTEQNLCNYLTFTEKLNSFLPQDISIKKLVPVRNDAHARFDAISRRYEYHLITEKNVFLGSYAMRSFHPLNFEKMNEAAAILFEFTDFTSFSKLHTDVKTNNCQILYAKWEQKEDRWVFTIEANRFLRNMVRAIVGTLIEVGREKISLEEFRNIISQKNRSSAGMSVPAKGLFLTQVKYPLDIFSYD